MTLTYFFSPHIIGWAPVCQSCLGWSVQIELVFSPFVVVRNRMSTIASRVWVLSAHILLAHCQNVGDQSRPGLTFAADCWIVCESEALLTVPAVLILFVLSRYQNFTIQIPELCYPDTRAVLSRSQTVLSIYQNYEYFTIQIPGLYYPDYQAVLSIYQNYEYYPYTASTYSPTMAYQQSY
jgi:hypothetical protein